MALLLVMVSAPMHAGWNLLARRQRAEGAFFLGLLKWGAIVGLVPVVLSEIFAPSIPGKAWVCLLISGCCCGSYFFFLARSYASSDFTVVYPIARALPVLLVGLGDIVRGHSPSAVGWSGMGLVTIGCVLAPLTSFKDIRWKKYVNWASVWMVLTALATAAYSLSDKTAAEVLPQGPVSAAKYGYFLFLIAFLLYRGFWHWLPGETKESQKIKRSEVIMGWVLTYACYWMVLWAYQLVGQASYIVAFRQFSIVLGVVAAFAIYKERGLAVRIFAAAIITAGLVIIGLWG